MALLARLELLFSASRTPMNFTEVHPPSSWVLEPVPSSNFHYQEQEKNENGQDEPKRLLHTEGGVLQCLVRAASTSGAESPPRSLVKVPLVSRELFPRGKFPKFRLPSGNSDTEFRLSPRVTYVPLRSCGSPSGVSNPLYVGEGWLGNSPSPGALWNWWELHI